MKGLMNKMKTFAQIYNNQIHWIFDQEELPQFAPPANEIYDITELKDYLFEGDSIIENNDQYILFRNKNSEEIKLNKNEVELDTKNINVEEKSKKRKYNKKN